MQQSLICRRRTLCFVLGIFFLCAQSSAQDELVVSITALDPHGAVVEGIRFVYFGVESAPTTRAGMTEMRVPLPLGQQMLAGAAIEVALDAVTGRTWFLIDDTIHVPARGEPPVEVVVMKRSDLLWIASAVGAAEASGTGGEISPESKRQAALEKARELGLDEVQLERAMRAFGDTATNSLDRGVVAYLGNAYEAAEHNLRQALAEAKHQRQVGRGVVGSAEQTIVSSARYLGQAHYEQGECDEAALAFQDGLEVRPEDTSLLAGRGNSLMKCARWREAEPVLRHALALEVDENGPNDARVAWHLNNLAALLRETDRLLEAERLFLRALAIDEERLGAEHPDVAIRLNNLALLYLKADEPKRAEALLRRALVIVETAHGPEHRQFARTLNHLALALQKTGRLGDAERTQRQALAVARVAFGSRHPEMATIMGNLGQILRDSDQLEEAEVLLREALYIDEATYGPSHPDVAVGLNNLALALQNANRLAEAEPMIRRSLLIHESSFGVDHTSVAVVLGNLAILLRQMGRCKEGDVAMERADQILGRQNDEPGEVGGRLFHAPGPTWRDFYPCEEVSASEPLSS